MLATDGTLTASEIKGEGRRAKIAKNEVDVEGTDDDVEVDGDGKVIRVVVDGIVIIIDVLTKFEGRIEVGVSVKAEGVLVDGVFVLGEIQSDEHGDPHKE